MDESVELVAADHVSAVADVRDVPLSDLVAQSQGHEGGGLARILDYDARGLLTVASFNAVI